MLARAILLVLSLAQAGCMPAIYVESRRVTREGTGAAIALVVPDAPRGPAADCAMKRLTQAEIVMLPNSGTFEDPARAEAFARDLMARPGVAVCIGVLPRRG